MSSSHHEKIVHTFLTDVFAIKSMLFVLKLDFGVKESFVPNKGFIEEWCLKIWLLGGKSKIYKIYTCQFTAQPYSNSYLYMMLGFEIDIQEKAQLT